jgi:Holliday junction resolvase-like predicted endonuclease
MIDHSDNRKGDLAEYYAVTWLWDQGYEVFHNCGCDGAIDLIAMAEDGTIVLIDVKTTRPGHNTSWGTSNLSDKQKVLGVRKLMFNAETRELFFVEHRHEKTSIGHRDEHHTQYDLVLSDSGC